VWDTFAVEKSVALKVSEGAIAAALHPAGLLLARRGRHPELRAWPAGNVLHTSPVFGVHSSNAAFTPDGLLVLCGYDSVQCWDVAGQSQRWQVRHTATSVNRVAGGSGGRFAAVTDFHRLTLWDAATGEQVATGEKTGVGEVLDLAFSPDGGTLAFSAAYDLHLWDVATWTERARVRLPAPCTRLAYRPDGSELFGSTHGPIRVWEPDLSREVRAFDFGLSELLDLTFAPDGHRAAAGCGDGRVVVWDLD
jgi:WD40 repeat protein